MNRTLATGGALLMTLAAAGCSSEIEKAPEAPPPPACESITFDGAAFTHCTAVPGRHTIHLVIGPKGAAPYRSLSQLALDRADHPRPVAFAMNGGMFDDAGYPIGYAVIEGERIHKLNTNEGAGNFHLMPNGVFYGRANGGWAVRSSKDFAAKVDHRPDFGTQSGPMLVIDGKLHPKIDENGTSLKLRNGVGVDAKGRAHFLIADEPVSFGKLARAFRDRLACSDALFLDGSVSSLWDPEHGRVDGGPPLGPLIVVEKATKGPDRKAAP